MADSDEGREDTICEVVTESSLDSVFELKRIKCTPSICDASPTDTDRSLVAIRDYAPDDSPRTSLVFPPANHENLPSRFVAENDDSSSSFSPSGSDSGDPSNPPLWTQHPPPKTVAGSARWWNFGIEFLHSKFNGIVKHLLSFASVPGAISPSYSPVGRATLAAAVLIFKTIEGVVILALMLCMSKIILIYVPQWSSSFIPDPLDVRAQQAPVLKTVQVKNLIIRKIESSFHAFHAFLNREIPEAPTCLASHKMRNKWPSLITKSRMRDLKSHISEESITVHPPNPLDFGMGKH
nr:uncharacterized protein LOC109162826 isoform X2 [Ipomoea batatas]